MPRKNLKKELKGTTLQYDSDQCIVILDTTDADSDLDHTITEAAAKECDVPSSEEKPVEDPDEGKREGNLRSEGGKESDPSVSSSASVKTEAKEKQSADTFGFQSKTKGDKQSNPSDPMTEDNGIKKVSPVLTEVEKSEQEKKGESTSRPLRQKRCCDSAANVSTPVEPRKKHLKIDGKLSLFTITSPYFWWLGFTVIIKDFNRKKDTFPI